MPARPAARVDILYLGDDLLQIRQCLVRDAKHHGDTQVLGHELVDVSELPVDAGEELAGEQVVRIDVERPLRPDERVVVLPLMPIRHRDLHQHERRSRIARERLLLEPQALVEPSERFLQRRRTASSASV